MSATSKVEAWQNKLDNTREVGVDGVAKGCIRNATETAFESCQVSGGEIMTYKKESAALTPSALPKSKTPSTTKIASTSRFSTDSDLVTSDDSSDSEPSDKYSLLDSLRIGWTCLNKWSPERIVA